MKNLIIPGLSFLCVFFLVMWLTNGCQDKPSTPPEDTTLWRDRVAAREAVIRAKDSLIAKIRQTRSLDSINHLYVAMALKRREAALVRKLKEANADIKVIADSLPKVARYVELADSTIAVKDSLYHGEVNRRLMAEKSYQFEIAQLADKHIRQVQMSNDLTTVVTDLKDKNYKLERKLERKKRINRLLIGVGAGLAAAIGILTISQ